MSCCFARQQWSLVALIACALLLSGGVAYASDCDRRGGDVVEPQPPSVLIVMDASKSMGEPAGEGQTRLQVAKAALRRLVDGLPEDARAGLRLYGHRVSGTTRAEGCRDTELVTPVRAVDRDALTSAIGSYRAVGSTPIGRALRAAARDLPATGPTSIVLVSDGGDNCAPPDPCRVAGELAVALRALAARATRTYRPTGRHVTGGTASAGAAPIGSGRFVDRIGADEERWYAVRLALGQRLAAAAVVSHRCPFGKRPPRRRDST